MRSSFCGILLLVLSTTLPLSSQIKPQAVPNGGDFSNNVTGSKVPQGVILVKGAWSSASDSTTPVPEGGSVANGAFANPYFGMSYTLPPDWTEKYEGPPPSETGRYVLAQLGPADTYRGSSRGLILITAQDMFFNPLPASNAVELVNYSKNHLQADYKVELPPSQTTIAGRPFTFFAYWSPIAELHWYVLTTEARCHTLQIIMSSQDTKLLEKLVLDLNRMKLPEDADPKTGTGGGSSPACVKDYANDENLVTRVDPVFSERRFNSVPVRIIIDEQGKVKHIHFLSAFPEQSKAITDALKQWKFKPYLRNGKPTEVETGIMFGRPSFPLRRTENSATE
ncbi:MAG TPA: energy transducer TonB [Candidatus Sulfotelmatobacter sp.]|jgi:hypothetical protein